MKNGLIHTTLFLKVWTTVVLLAMTLQTTGQTITLFTSLDSHSFMLVANGEKKGEQEEPGAEGEEEIVESESEEILLEGICRNESIDDANKNSLISFTQKGNIPKVYLEIPMPPPDSMY
ncbi:MAG: hypothetical protein K0U54_00130 [Bacteroidetes bacterium]|nr:hypothetical protein [Bacteroidota bacterium]